MNNTLTQEQLDSVFQSELGQQLDSFYVLNLPDGKHQIHIRVEEAIDVAKEYNLSDECVHQSIEEYYAEWSGKDLFPTAIKYEK